MKKLILLLLIYCLCLGGCSAEVMTMYEYSETKQQTILLEKEDVPHGEGEKYSIELDQGTDKTQSYNMELDCSPPEIVINYEMIDINGDVDNSGTLTCEEPVVEVTVSKPIRTINFTTEEHTYYHAGPAVIGEVTLYGSGEYTTYYLDIVEEDYCTRVQGLTVYWRQESEPQEIECSEVNLEGEKTSYTEEELENAIQISNLVVSEAQDDDVYLTKDEILVRVNFEITNNSFTDIRFVELNGKLCYDFKNTDECVSLLGMGEEDTPLINETIAAGETMAVQLTIPVHYDATNFQVEIYSDEKYIYTKTEPVNY